MIPQGNSSRKQSVIVYRPLGLADPRNLFRYIQGKWVFSGQMCFLYFNNPVICACRIMDPLILSLFQHGTEQTDWRPSVGVRDVTSHTQQLHPCAACHMLPHSTAVHYDCQCHVLRPGCWFSRQPGCLQCGQCSYHDIYPPDQCLCHPCGSAHQPDYCNPVPKVQARVSMGPSPGYGQEATKDTQWPGSSKDSLPYWKISDERQIWGR